jgi:hypothetical protein
MLQQADRCRYTACLCSRDLVAFPSWSPEANPRHAWFDQPCAMRPGVLTARIWLPNATKRGQYVSSQCNVPASQLAGFDGRTQHAQTIVPLESSQIPGQLLMWLPEIRSRYARQRACLRSWSFLAMSLLHENKVMATGGPIAREKMRSEC